MICNQKPRLPDVDQRRRKPSVIKGNELALPGRAGSRQRLVVLVGRDAGRAATRLLYNNLQREALEAGIGWSCWKVNPLRLDSVSPYQTAKQSSRTFKGKQIPPLAGRGGLTPVKTTPNTYAHMRDALGDRVPPLLSMFDDTSMWTTRLAAITKRIPRCGGNIPSLATAPSMASPERRRRGDKVHPISC